MTGPDRVRPLPSEGEAEVWDALGRFLRSRQPWVRRASEAAGVPPPQLWVLVYLTEFGPTSAGDLSRYLGVTPAAVTFVTHELQRKGCVELEPSIGDRRRVMVRILPGGRQKVRRLLRWRLDLGHQALGGFSLAERVEFARLLRKFSEGMNALAPARGLDPRGAGSNSRLPRGPRA